MAYKIAAIILSAGYSSRMGEFKPLLPFGDGTVLERDISLFRDAGIDDVRVVIGHRAAELLPLVERLNTRPVINDRYHDGMFTSVRAGVENLESEIEAFFLLPVDIPLVRPATVQLLAESFDAGTGSVFYPVFYGKRGHPPLISAHYREEIVNWHGEGGLKSLIFRHEAEAVNIDTGDENILLDMDTLAEYERLRTVWRRNAVPSVLECENLLIKTFAAEMPLVDHCRRVAKLAVFLVKQLNEAGCRLDQDLTEACALLHDLGKGKPNHAAEGARILKEMGYPDIARVIATHMNIKVAQEEPVRIAEVLYLADKMTNRSRWVSVEERFAPRIRSSSSDPEMRSAVAGRLESALQIKSRLEMILGRPLYEILAERSFL
ncbi:MAG: DVU_1551 family NTP transferase [Geobacteraceae bacterium]